MQNLLAASQLKIVTSTSTFASIAQEIAGNEANIYSIASPNRDIHFIAPTPKDILKLKKADVFIHGGLDLEIWRGPLLDAVGKTDLMWPNGERQIDVSKGISLLEIPTSLSRVQGDIHVFGNPHYWIDPMNGKIIAQNIAAGLSKLYPEQANFFAQNLQNFNRKLDEAMQRWEKQMSPYQGTSIVTYHNSWPYFAQRFGLKVAGYIEPNPGIPPTAKHMAELIELMNKVQIKMIVKESFHEKKTPEKIAAATGAQVVNLAQSVGENKQNQDYFGLFDYDIGLIVEALSIRHEGENSHA
ncbi:MAG: zinc ABC transporter substrate-binding protein [Candidatus Omnitrophica bacterium]|nr:zinc ABC transporter substrate-binding protein [Candidatus Omnitrophota bacterium]